MSVKKVQKGKKKVTTLALSLNTLVLQPFLGYTALHRQMGHVDFIYNMFSMLNAYWQVPWLCFTRRAGSKHCDLLTAFRVLTEILAPQQTKKKTSLLGVSQSIYIPGRSDSFPTLCEIKRGMILPNGLRLVSVSHASPVMLTA